MAIWQLRIVISFITAGDSINLDGVHRFVGLNQKHISAFTVTFDSIGKVVFSTMSVPKLYDMGTGLSAIVPIK